MLSGIVTTHAIRKNNDPGPNGLYDKPCEDAVFSDNEHRVGGVWDGVTYPRNYQGEYQQPSPATIAAQILASVTCESLIRDLGNRLYAVQALKNAMTCGNEAVGQYNKAKKIKIDYLQNDLACAVGIIACVVKSKLYYAYIGDSAGYIRRAGSAAEPFTKTQTKKMEVWRAKLAKTIGSKDEARREAHRLLRNTTHECGYGALTGEPAALEFVIYDEIELSGDEIIWLTSDGLDCVLAANPTIHFAKPPEDVIDEAEASEQQKGIRSDDKTIVEFRIPRYG